MLKNPPAGKKTAIVVEPGLTQAIMKLLADGLRNQLSIDCRTFNRLEDALEWIGPAQSKVA
jgi:hypothetical protein